VIDRDGRKIGRVDGVVIDTNGSGRPRVAALEIGATTLANRTPGLVSKWLNWMIARVTGSQEIKLSIAMNKAEIEHNEIHVAVDADSTPVRALEHWLRERIVMRIPGA
jgi:hypothetical protein